jgi:hypothetical protein
MRCSHVLTTSAPHHPAPPNKGLTGRALQAQQPYAASTFTTVTTKCYPGYEKHHYQGANLVPPMNKRPGADKDNIGSSLPIQHTCPAEVGQGGGGAGGVGMGHSTPGVLPTLFERWPQHPHTNNTPAAPHTSSTTPHRAACDKPYQFRDTSNANKPGFDRSHGCCWHKKSTASQGCTFTTQSTNSCCVCCTMWSVEGQRCMCGV